MEGKCVVPNPDSLLVMVAVTGAVVPVGITLVTRVDGEEGDDEGEERFNNESFEVSDAMPGRWYR